MASLRAEILQAIATRLATISISNGYSITPKKVYFDKIPMGIQLNSTQVPALFLIDGPDQLELEMGCLKGNWEFRLQLWHNQVGDIAMNEYVRDVLKAIYADSPTAHRVDAFRSLHAAIVEFIPLSISPDLHMIEANRVTELAFLVRYRTKLFNT